MATGFDRMDLNTLRLTCPDFERDAVIATEHRQSVREEERTCWFWDCPDENDVRAALVAESNARSRANKCSAAINAILAGRDPDPSVGVEPDARGPTILTIEESIAAGLAPEGSVRADVDRPPLERALLGLPVVGDAIRTSEDADALLNKINDTIDAMTRATKTVGLVAASIWVVSKMG